MPAIIERRLGLAKRSYYKKSLKLLISL
ncbi:hypothetical protein FOXB_05048 [Fusarium oxysporum f. sp. conglutinans Fo5176]|uniref:Uncharacterized protein n=1 Tax=Fusarium oxysporum (strain Fo5176) TaxID=660025 RepID=F9FF69_FUSOF|nr:hypothetical protein FOXB_05048 [Fusarium oxysporum f. sp. conglutinans Fo5176]